MVHIISISGNIGAGKTTALNLLKCKYGYPIFLEDVEGWLPLLTKFYEDPKRWCFTLEMLILESTNRQFDTIESNYDENDIVFIESTQFCSQVFANVAYSKQNLSEIEYETYTKCVDRFTRNVSLKYYIDTPVEVCVDHIQRRGRDCEKEITSDYLQSIDDEYKKYKFDHMINGDKDSHDIVRDIMNSSSFRELHKEILRLQKIKHTQEIEENKEILHNQAIKHNEEIKRNREIIHNQEVKHTREKIRNQEIILRSEENEDTLRSNYMFM